MTCKEPIPDSFIWLCKKEVGRSPFIPCDDMSCHATKYITLNVRASVYSLGRNITTFVKIYCFGRQRILIIAVINSVWSKAQLTFILCLSLKLSNINNRCISQYFWSKIIPVIIIRNQDGGKSILLVFI